MKRYSGELAKHGFAKIPACQEDASECDGPMLAIQCAPSSVHMIQLMVF